MVGLITHHTLIFVSACVTATLGGLLSGIHIPPDVKWRNLRIARGYLALACFILAGFNLLNFFLQSEANSSSIQDALILYIASYQALLFTMTLLTFIQPLYVRKEVVVPQLATITVAGVSLLLSLFLWEPLFPVLFHISMAAYLFQLIFYTVLFRRKYLLCLKQLEEYYDEDKDNRLKWVECSFYTALGVGIMALLSLFLAEWAYDLFIVVYTAFYAYVTGRFLNYINNDMKFVIPAVTRKTNGAEQRREKAEETPPRSFTRKERNLKTALEEWVKEKQFSQKDIGVEETAQSLGTDCYFLRYYFRTYMQCDFRTWRSELRIREAQRILDEDPETSLACVCEAVGFNDRGNFHRQFTKITGITPANYKQRCSSTKQPTQEQLAN